MDESLADSIKAPHKHSHPAVFMFLILPFGIIGGYVTVALAFLLSNAGVSILAIAPLVGAGILPQMLKFIWAPLVDTTLSLKKWYVLSCVVSAAAVFACGIFPLNQSSIAMLTLINIMANVAVSFIGIVSNGLLAYDTPNQLKGTASGYINAGNLGGAGLGGGVGLLLAQHLPAVWMSSAIIAAICLLCCVALFFIKEPTTTIRTQTVVKTVQNLFKDVWDTIKAKSGYLALTLCFLPLSTGAASNLWSAVAGGWHASANTVAVVTGIASGFITAGGALAGGWICDRMDRKRAYIVFGIIQIVCAVAMAYSPHNELMYITWTSIYAFSLGLAYAGFSALVFETIGKGAAGTKATLYASLSNTPIWYMTIVDGLAYTLYGPKGMLVIEAACGALGIILFFILFQLVGGNKVVAKIAQ